MVSAEFLGKLAFDDNGIAREGIQYLQEAVQVFIWNLVVRSVVVHGLASLLAKACCQIPLKSTLALHSTTQRC